MELKVDIVSVMVDMVSVMVDIVSLKLDMASVMVDMVSLKVAMALKEVIVYSRVVRASAEAMVLKEVKALEVEMNLVLATDSVASGVVSQERETASIVLLKKPPNRGDQLMKMKILEIF